MIFFGPFKQIKDWYFIKQMIAEIERLMQNIHENQVNIINIILSQMKEIITINVGGCGMKIGNEILSQYIEQHQLDQKSQSVNISNGSAMDNHVMFQQLQNGGYKYRCINIDCEQDTLDDILTDKNRNFYSPKRFIGGKQSSGGMFSKGKMFAQKQLKQPFEDEFRKVIESCNSVQGVIFNCASLGGGAGLLQEFSIKVSQDLSVTKTPKIGNILFPSERFSSSVVQIYNYTLSSGSLLNYLDLVIPYDNQTLYSTCEEYLDVDRPSFPEINQMIAQVNSSVTLSMRHTGVLNTRLNDLLTNLVCYPRIHFLYPSFVGFKKDNRNKLCFQSDYLTKSILDKKARLVNIAKINNKIAMGLFYRGSIGPYEIHQSLNKLKNQKYYNIDFEEWSPLGFKIAVDSTPLNNSNDRVNSLLSSPSCCSLTSSMEFHQFFGSYNQKFDRLFARRSFVHHYISDIQEGEFVEARQDLAALQKDYENWDGGCCQYQEEE